MKLYCHTKKPLVVTAYKGLFLFMYFFTHSQKRTFPFGMSFFMLHYLSCVLFLNFLIIAIVIAVVAPMAMAISR